MPHRRNIQDSLRPLRSLRLINEGAMRNCGGNSWNVRWITHTKAHSAIKELRHTRCCRWLENDYTSHPRWVYSPEFIPASGFPSSRPSPNHTIRRPVPAQPEQLELLIPQRQYFWNYKKSSLLCIASFNCHLPGNNIAFNKYAKGWVLLKIYFAEILTPGNSYIIIITIWWILPVASIFDERCPLVHAWLIIVVLSSILREIAFNRVAIRHDLQPIYCQIRKIKL